MCGPKSARVGAALIAGDPALTVTEDAGRWWIEDRRTGERTGSPADDQPARPADVAYLSRRRQDGRVIVHIAGIHAIGSLGAAHYLPSSLAALFRQHGRSVVLRRHPLRLRRPVDNRERDRLRAAPVVTR